jgi:dihydroxy-acid dehydratase
VTRSKTRTDLASAAGRAPARAHFRAMGIDPARLDGAIVGIASTWTGTMPCNLNQRELARRVADGVAEAGGVPLEFNTIAVSDNQSQATPGMRASLVSREVIADSIELMVHAHDFDAVVCLVGCDKTVPAALMALARVDKPAVVLYSGPMRAGRLRAREVTIQDVWEAVGAEERGLIPRAELDELERHACPGAGTCAGHFTANTMAVALDCLGIACIGDGLIPADELGAKGDAAARAGALAVELGATARAFLDRRALLNAMAGIAATGGSTNGILHLLAIAREAGVELSLDELAEVSAHTPVLASLAPSGRYMAEDLHRAGGTRVLLRELVRGGHVDGSAPTVEGMTLAEATQDAPPPDREVLFTLEAPYKSNGALHALRGNLAPDGSLVKASGAVRRAHRGPARVYENEESCTAAVRSGEVRAGDVLV